jgi:hypothetical protein
MCTRCHGRDPRRFDTESKRDAQLKIINSGPEEQEKWNVHIYWVKNNIASNGKTKGCHADPTGLCKPKDPDREGLDKKISGKKRREMLATKNCGVHWPAWRFKNECEARVGQTPPKIKRMMTVAGEKGPVTDDSWGCPVACSRMEYQLGDGIEMEDELAKGSRMNDEGEPSKPIGI